MQQPVGVLIFQLFSAVMAGLLAILASACGSAPTRADPPAWVLLPETNGGFAAAACVPDSGNIGMDRQWALAKARADIAQQIGVRVKAIDQTYSRISSGTPGGESFESVSEQIAEQTLAGSNASRAEFLEFGGKRQFCILASLAQAQGQELFRSIVSASGRKLDSATDETLYREFVGLP